MYRLFEPFWFQRAPITLVESFAQFAPMPPPPSRGRCAASCRTATSPRSSTATRRCPTRPRTAPSSAAFLADLTQHIDVVLLNTGHRFDDHEDLPPQARGPRAHRRAPDDARGQPRRCRRRSSAHAEAFVGTYGGFSYLAPLVRHRHPGVLLAPDRLPLRSPRGGQAGVLRPALRRRSSSSTCAPLDVVTLGFGGRLSAPVSELAAKKPRVARRAGPWHGRRGGREGRAARHARGGASVRDGVINAAKACCAGAAAGARASRRRRRSSKSSGARPRRVGDRARDREASSRAAGRWCVGPWISEVGFETLYWIPFLHWVKARVPARARSAGRRLARRRRRLVQGHGRPLHRDLGPHRSGGVRAAQRRARRHQAVRASPLDATILDGGGRRARHARLRRAPSRA